MRLNGVSTGIVRAVAAAGCILTLTAAASKQPEQATLKPDDFVTTWLALAPITVSGPPDEPSLKRAWGQDWLSAAGGESKVRPHVGSINTVAQQTEEGAPRHRQRRCDQGLVERKLVHENWAIRSMTPDDDVVPVELQRGKNTLIVKVLNVEGGCRSFPMGVVCPGSPVFCCACRRNDSPSSC